MKNADPWSPIVVGTEKKKTQVGRAVAGLVKEKISILPLFQCDPNLFRAAKSEAMALTWGDGRRHSTWRIPKMTFHQYNLYSRGDDPDDFIEEYDVWKPKRHFIPGLSAIPELLKHYFGATEMQNCRLLTVNHLGALGGHREPIIKIMGRPDHYKLRFHMPFSTSTRVKFYMGEETHTMKEGHFYLYNQSCLHAVKNVLGIQRAHLVFDYFLNPTVLEKLIIPALKHQGEN